MKFTYNWLKKFLDTDKSVSELAEILTMLGLEVEEIIDRREELKDFEVAQIVTTKPHPSADKLKICEVQTKEGILQIICGASNARQGLKVVLAKVGSEIPNGKFKIKESLIRGEKSCGMLCSEDELLLSSASEGIIELPDFVQVGESFINYYGISDPVFHINITPNRGDALGVYGIARDLAAKNIGKLKQLEIKEIKDAFQSNLLLDIRDTVAAPLFAVREIRNLRNQESPDWLKQLLQNIGVKPISAIVDVTNYISYSFGQPMHAYDKSKFLGNVQVSLLKEKVKFAALNGKEYHLEEGDLVIADSSNVQGISGIIGGENSSCSLETQNILLEAACFTPQYITQTGRRLQVDTDARYRFERNVDQGFTIQALNIASEMIISICGGEASQIIYEEESKPVQQSIEFSVDFLTKLIGMSLGKGEVCDILERLGFLIEDKNHSILKVSVPSWRQDVKIKEDLVEEIVRIYGYDRLEQVKLPQMEISRIIPKEQKRIFDIKRILASCGYDEVVTNSFMYSEIAKLFSPIKEDLLLLNPINIENDYMRPTIISNLLKIVQKNLDRSIKDLAVMEVGPIFDDCGIGGEKLFAAGIKSGQYSGKNCHSEGRLFDVFDIKSDLATILDYMNLSIDKCQFGLVDLPYYHPTKSASIKLGKSIIAYFGQIHPAILKYFNITQDVFAFELDIANIPFGKAKFGRRDEYIVSDYQPTIRDYAFIVDIVQPVGDIVAAIKNIDKKIIKSVDLFDIYSGNKLPEGKKSVAIKVQFQADDRTLNEDDLNNLSNGIISAIDGRFHGQLRNA